MGTTHRDRQATYRFWHPQRNITFRYRSEWHEVMHALQLTGKTPGQVLVQWAHQVTPLGDPPAPSSSDSPDPPSTRDSSESLQNLKDLDSMEQPKK